MSEFEKLSPWRRARWRGKRLYELEQMRDELRQKIDELHDELKLVEEVIKIKYPKVRNKPGPKGNKIEEAFRAIPSTPVDAKKFCAKHGISLNTLRQVKRYDTIGEPPVQVRKLHRDGPSYVWRGKPDLLTSIIKEKLYE